MEIFGSGAHAWSVKTFFFMEITCFWPEKPFEFLSLAEKNLQILEKTFFFMEIICFRLEKPFEFLSLAENTLRILEKTFFFMEITCFWPQKPYEFLSLAEKTLNFGKNLFFFGDNQNLTKKTIQSRLKVMKIWVKFVYGCIKLPKKPPPPPLRNSGYAPELEGTSVQISIFLLMPIYFCFKKFFDFFL